MEQKPFPFEVCKKCCNESDNLLVDQTYTPESENAQSGKAVAGALKTIEPLIVTVAINEAFGGLEANHTYGEIKEAYNSGREIYARVYGFGIDGKLLSLTECANLLQFSVLAKNRVHELSCTIGSIWSYEETELTKTDDVNVFTINATVNATVNGPVVENITITADKTFKEIKTAYNEGKEIRLIVTGYEGLECIITNVCLFDDVIMFYGTQTDSNYQICCVIDDKWDYIKINNASKTELDNKENTSNKVTRLAAYNTDEQYPSAKVVYDNIVTKADKPAIIVNKESTEYTIKLSERNNHIIRLDELEKLSVIAGFEKFGDIPENYGADVSFFSGETPTIIDDAEAYYMCWLGVDCSNENGASKFQPLAGKVYDIVFYNNGFGLVGLVNGYQYSASVPAPIM